MTLCHLFEYSIHRDPERKNEVYKRLVVGPGIYKALNAVYVYLEHMYRTIELYSGYVNI